MMGGGDRLTDRQSNQIRGRKEQTDSGRDSERDNETERENKERE